MKNVRLGIMAVALMAGCSTAHAKSVSAADPQGILTAVKAQGYRAELTQNDAGETVIKAGTNTIVFSISFFGCVEHVNCSKLVFSSKFKAPNKVTAATAEKFNRMNRYLRAFVTESGVAFTAMSIFAGAKDGLSEIQFAYDLLIFERGLKAFIAMHSDG